MRLTIIGAGMAGLLAGNILRRHSPVLREAQSSLPDNHGALLRFRTDAVERETKIPLKAVNVQKAIRKYGTSGLITTPDLRLSNMYSLKVSGEVMSRSILDLAPVTRYVAPDTFLDDLGRGLNIKLGSTVNRGILHTLLDSGSKVISTIPMPAMMSIMGWKDKPEFKYCQIWSLRADVLEPRVNVFQTIYYPDPEGEPYYRASLTGGLLTVEFLTDPFDLDAEIVVRDILEGDFGIRAEELRIYPPKHQRFGKLLPIDEEVRRSFIYGLSAEYGIYSIGRFATWRQILLDDVVKDISVVATLISDKDSYTRHLAYMKE